MSETTTISLGGRTFTARPLTFRQLRDLEVGNAKAITPGASPPESQMQFYNAVIEVLVAVLKRDNPEVTADFLMDLETSREEVVAAYRKALEHSGLKLPKPKADGEDQQPGEAAAAASTGDGSTPV